jgi:hypothetical protein
VIFAHPEVRDFVAATFIPAWESVRPVPTVTIDFGGGRTLKRTVNGNIATYVCRPDGTVVDLLPGLRTPEAYLEDLRRAVALTRLSDEAVLAHHAQPSKPRGRSDRGGLDASKVMGVEPRVKKAILNPDRALLENDTATNRLIRGPLVHAILAERLWTSAELTKRVYRDVLNCDLDDPYLGLGEAAFNGGAYPSR